MAVVTGTLSPVRMAPEKVDSLHLYPASLIRWSWTDLGRAVVRRQSGAPCPGGSEGLRDGGDSFHERLESESQCSGCVHKHNGLISFLSVGPFLEPFGPCLASPSLALRGLSSSEPFLSSSLFLLVAHLISIKSARLSWRPQALGDTLVPKIYPGRTPLHDPTLALPLRKRSR